MPALSVPIMSALLGAALALCNVPLPWSPLAFVPLAAVLWYAAQGSDARGVSVRLLWSGVGLFTVHLWWLTAFLNKLLGTGTGVLAFALFLLEGAFLAVMAYPLARLVRDPVARVWALAGAWVILEWLRFLGPLAFPWPTLGATLLPSPAIQIADLGGVLLGSVLVTFTAASLAAFALTRRPWGRGRLLAYAALAWAVALGYGLTRTPGSGPVQPVLVLRTPFDSFGRASGYVSPEEQERQQRVASQRQTHGEVVVWSETAITAPGRPAFLPSFVGPGISGVGSGGAEPEFNAVAAIDARSNATSWSDKSKLVPFGEYFPLYRPLHPLYAIIENAIHIRLGGVEESGDPRPLTLNGVRYGAYVCYDSVFPWVARSLAKQGAQLLVNPSNDGWYDGWGVLQHFAMGRVRAIETRRWLVRSVNRGVAGSVNDLGQPVQTVAAGETMQVLHVRPRLLSGTTVYMRVGDLPALLLAALMIVYAFRTDGRARRW
ncbi:apolipoprotein N-acyltransferase [Deinococcus metalli]|uniref:Apolipoprotein N-acyltransferase n=1 Tax=Deinococcus metalli TaxID=1141878 RepID=A0A7W8NN25_9DEIO|nr:apolipoprotein N-acyltransferase [Deinococcus metalli]MBB5375291.1 apolipoprotein N-acyltransferase [Deinococcus metalli]